MTAPSTLVFNLQMLIFHLIRFRDIGSTYYVQAATNKTICVGTTP